MSNQGPLVVVGDTLLDRDVDGTVARICPDAPAPVLDERSSTARPGGAGLAALLAAAQGREVVLVTGLAQDAAGQHLRELLTGVRIAVLPLPGSTVEKIRLRADAQVLLRLDRGNAGPPAPGELPADVAEALRTAAAILVSDYGRGVAGHPQLRAALAAASAPVVWDPHPRGSEPVPGVHLVTPNAAEAAAATGIAGPALSAVTAAGHELRRRWQARAVAVTRGADGAVLCQSGPTPLVVGVPQPASGDTCGAGDRFAVAAATALADGALLSEAVQRAVRAASDYVAAGGVTAALSTPDGAPGARAGEGATVGVDGPPPVGDSRTAEEIVAAVRAAGGTVVATGGCFDLLHAGHAATLQAARALGNCLIVCLNSDTGVTALKGPGRPVNSEQDRAALLTALGSVDAVVVFDEPTPAEVLSRLRPDIWVKGGDYADGGPGLPEADLVRGWGGQAVVVPYLTGRSTTTMIARARTSRQTEGAA